MALLHIFLIDAILELTEVANKTNIQNFTYTNQKHRIRVGRRAQLLREGKLE